MNRIQSKGFSMNSLTLVLLVTLSLAVVFVVLHVSEFFRVLEGSNDRNSLDRIKLKTRAASLLKEIETKNEALTHFFDNKGIHIKPTLFQSNSEREKEKREQNIDAENKQDSVYKIQSNMTGISKLHPILFLSDEDFKTIPLSVMMSWYGESSGGGTCSGDFGYSLAKRWRDTKKTYCSPIQLNQNEINSKIDCFLVKQSRHAGSGDNLCLMNNVSVNLGQFSDEDFTTPVVERYVNTMHAQQPYIPLPKGFINAKCTIDDSLWKPQHFPGWNKDWVYESVETSKSAKIEFHDCTDSIEHNVLIVQRDTFANFFHDSEDFFNVFLAMAILEWKVKDTQIYLTDLYPNGPFWEMWSKVFGFSRPPVTAWDIRNKYLKYEGKAKTCFKSIAIGIYGPAAPVTVASWDTPCSRTALVRAYSDFVIRGLNIQSHTQYYQQTPRKTVKITFMARRASVEWPEKHFCDSSGSFFKCQYWDNFGIRTLGRMVTNEKHLIERLKELEGEKFSNGAEVQVTDADYNLMTLEEQIKSDLDTDIMIGPHGAGLMHNIFMPDRSALMELFIDGSGVNRHFHNLANWYGRDYYDISTGNPVNVEDIVNRVRNVVQSMNLNKY